MNQLDNLTILVSSCDKYEEAWGLFFALLKKYGGELAKLPIILNTESKVYNYDGLNIKTTSSEKNTMNWEWGRRFKHALSLVETEYVLVVLEDMFLQRDANVSTIKKCVQWLDENKNAACFNLLPLPGVKKGSLMYEGFCFVEPGTPYRINAQACIWRKEDLDKSMLPEESPWDWEIYGNMRNDHVLKDREVYVLSWKEEQPFFIDFYIKGKDIYNQQKAHSGIMRGKWDVALVEPLCRECDIHINFDNLGRYEEPKYPVKEKIKRIFPFSLMYKIYRCIRKRKYDEIAKRDELNLKSSEKYQKFVAPYIDDKA